VLVPPKHRTPPFCIFCMKWPLSRLMNKSKLASRPKCFEIKHNVCPCDFRNPFSISNKGFRWQYRERNHKSNNYVGKRSPRLIGAI